ncbi:MAG: GNAT family N-acetyltransferase, partial [Rhodospirillaceae bacterium]
HTVEHSVYVRPDLRGGGVGTALLQSVIDHARSAGHHVMVAAISADNGGSIRLHARLGFVETGRMPEVGTKFGRWLDLVLMQIQL